MPDSVITTKNYELSVQVENEDQTARAYIHIPGMPEHNKLAHVQGSLKTAAELGFLALSPNPPGLWGSKLRSGSGTVADYQMRHNVNSTFELCQHLLTEVNPKMDIVIGGNSAGNRPAAYAAAILPEQVVGYFSIFGASTFIRDSNRVDRTIIWKKRGYKSFEIEDPEGNLTSVDVPWPYAKWAPAYDTHLITPTIQQEKLFISGLFDEVAVPKDVRDQFDSAKDPKQLVWLPFDHYCRTATAEELRDSGASDEKISIDGLRKILAGKRQYSDPEAITKMNTVLAEWLKSRIIAPGVLSPAAGMLTNN